MKRSCSPTPNVREGYKKMTKEKIERPGQLENLLSAVGKSRSYLIGLLSKMVAIPTVNPPGQNYRKFCEFMGEELHGIGISDVELVSVPRERLTKSLPEYANYERVSLVAHYRQGDYPTLHLNGHFDVVPPTSGWTRDPFAPEQVGDKLYGRGAGDMKGLGAAMVTVARAIINQTERPKVNIAFSFVGDEETGGELGAGYLAEQNKVVGDLALVEGIDGDCLTIANRGVIWVKLHFIGKPGHTTEPHKGKNAFLAAADCAMLLKNRAKRLLRAKRTAYPIKHPREAYSTINIGGAAGGGSKINTISDRFSFTVDIRHIPEMEKDEVLAIITEVLARTEARNKEVKTRMELMQVNPATIGDKEGYWIPLVDEAYHLALGRKTKHFLAPFYTDMRHLVAGGVPTLGIGSKVGGVHSDDEWVSIRGLVNIAKVMATVAWLLGEKGK
jgi:succinyl-diaminopimelate desuccinylase